MKYFTEDMTLFEAQTKLFNEVVGKSPTEKEQIKEEYGSILPRLIKKEMSGPATIMTEYPV